MEVGAGLSGLLDRNVQVPALRPAPQQRNRIVATFSPLPDEPFEKTGPAIQPVFQQAGFAPEILVRAPGGPFRLDRVTINHSGPYEVFGLSEKLYDGATKHAATRKEIEKFIHVVEQVSGVLTDQSAPKGWFSKKRGSSGIMTKPTFPQYDKTVEEAAALAHKYATYIAGLPPYQRHVLVEVHGVAVEAEELVDFAEFVGFPPGYKHDTWFHPGLATAMSTTKDKISFMILSVPLCPTPEIVYDNLVDAAKRAVMEFGGVIQVNEKLAQQVIVGWKNLLAPIGFVPGEEELPELFPLANPPAR